MDTIPTFPGWVKFLLPGLLSAYAELSISYLFFFLLKVLTLEDRANVLTIIISPALQKQESSVEKEWEFWSCQGF